MGKLICTVLRGLNGSDTIWLPDQLLENKARFIGQVITGEVTARSADDVGDVVLTAAEVKAIASGNPLILERFKRETEVAKLDRVFRAWHTSRTDLVWSIERTQRDIASRTTEIAHLAAVAAVYQPHRAQDFALTSETQVGDAQQVTWTKREDAGKKLLTLLKQYRTAAIFQRQTIARTVGSYRGASLVLKAPGHELSALTLRLVYTVDATEVVAWTHYLLADDEPQLTPQGLTTSMDAALRGITDDIRRKTDMNASDAATITTLEDERARTATWEHQERYDALRADVARITAELNAASAAAAAARADAATDPATADDAPTTDESTGVVSDDAIAAALAAAPENDPAWALEEPWTLPIAPDNLAVCDTLAATPDTSADDDVLEDAAAADAAAVLDAAESPEPIAVVAPVMPVPTRTARPRLTFGDLSALRPQATKRTKATPQTATRQLWDTDDVAQLPLFASAPHAHVAAAAAASHDSQQLALL